MSVTVTSQVTHLPFFQGISVSPSGRFPSDLRRPDGSLVAGMCAADRPRHTRSLRLWYRARIGHCHLYMRVHEILWHRPLRHMDTGEVHRCWHRVADRPRRALHCHPGVDRSLKVAVRAASHRCMMSLASSRALTVVSLKLFDSESRSDATIILSHADCLYAAVPDGCGRLQTEDQMNKNSFRFGYNSPVNASINERPKTPSGM